MNWWLGFSTSMKQPLSCALPQEPTVVCPKCDHLPCPSLTMEIQDPPSMPSGCPTIDPSLCTDLGMEVDVSPKNTTDMSFKDRINGISQVIHDSNILFEQSFNVDTDDDIDYSGNHKDNPSRLKFHFSKEEKKSELEANTNILSLLNWWGWVQTTTILWFD